MAEATSNVHGPRVLLLEDDTNERAILRELLEAEGIDVVAEASDGVEGVSLAEELRPDVVLSDLRMPVMGGMEATRLIKEALPYTQVIILTVYEGPLPTRSAEDVGAYAYLVKGCSVAFIRDVIMGAWNFKRGLDERASAT
jgi:DNA-binding NarL/FixJ family response regulator